MQIIRVRKGCFNVEFLCDYCGFVGLQRISHYKKKKRHFCSQACYSRFRKEVLPKHEHPCFGKGLSPEERAKRIKARSDANHAIRDGKLTKQSCRVCGKNAEMHHPDYNKPLDVDWYCRKHHWKVYEHPDLLEVK